MAKYGYDKSSLKGLKVGPFLGEVKLRQQKIAEADATPPKSVFNSNVLAKKLHPEYLCLVVKKVIDEGSAKVYVLGPDEKEGTKELSFFRAGQYLSMVFQIGKVITCRPYTICSSPKDAIAKNPTYSIMVKGVDGGLCSQYILKNWKPGTKILSSAPCGHYFYTDLRDAKHVVALAGGSGITPFYSMAKAIDEGTEDFKLTILYGSRVSSDILLEDELAAIEKRSAGKVKVVHVLSDEKKKGFENGFITADIIKKYAGNDDYSVFVCGPPAMYTFIMKEVNKLKLPLRRVRLEVPGETLDVKNLPGFKETKKGAKHNIKVHIRGEVSKVQTDEKTTIARALENAGIPFPTDCRSGKCGYCRSRLIKGDVWFAADNRRAADAKFGWIHPCNTYAKSDIELEIFPLI